jgi:hypothetical protein
MTKGIDFSGASTDKARIGKLEHAVGLLIQRELDFGARYVKYWDTEIRADFAMIAGYTKYKRQRIDRKGMDDVVSANLIVFSSVRGVHAVANVEAFVYIKGLPEDEQKRIGKFEPWHDVEVSETLKELFDKMTPGGEKASEANASNATAAA